MAYGLSTRVPAQDGPAEQVPSVEIAQPALPGWRALSEACRLEVVEQALRAANDRIDGYPIAL